MNRIVESGIEGNESILDELNKQWEEQEQKIYDTLVSAVKGEQDFVKDQKDIKLSVYDEQINKIKEVQEATEKANKAEIDAIQEKIDKLKETNDNQKKENELIKAKRELENAKNQRTRAVITNGMVSYVVDPKTIKEKEEKVRENAEYISINH